MPGRDKRNTKLSIDEQNRLAPAFRQMMIHLGMFNRTVSEHSLYPESEDDVPMRIVTSYQGQPQEGDSPLKDEYANIHGDMLYEVGYAAMVDMLNEANPGLDPLTIEIHSRIRGRVGDTDTVITNNAASSKGVMRVCLADEHYQFMSDAKEGPTGRTTTQGYNCSFASLLQLLRHYDKQDYLLALVQKAESNKFSHKGFQALANFAAGKAIDLQQGQKTHIVDSKQGVDILRSYAKQYASDKDKELSVSDYADTVANCMKAVGEFDLDKPLSTSKMALFVQNQAKILRDIEEQNKRDDSLKS